MQNTRRRLDLSVVDTDLLAKKENRKAFLNAAYAMGVAIGFLLLIPIVPEVGQELKNERMLDVFRHIAFVLIGYSLTMMLGYFVFRPNLALIRFVLNWFYMPAAVIYFATEAYDVIKY